MSSQFERNLEKYAEVAVAVGLNLQPGQRLLVTAPLEVAPLVRLIATQAYRSGARLVDVFWRDDDLRLIRLENAPRDSFEEYPKWRTDAMFEVLQAGDALLSIDAQTPDLLAGQDRALVATTQRVHAEHNEPIADLVTQNRMNWTVIAAPTAGWTAKVFPTLPVDRGIERLWNSIFDICRINEEAPVVAWQEHVAQLNARCLYLTRQDYVALRLRSLGTDLTLGLADGHIWRGGSATSQNAISFVSNLPTEEVFTTPHKNQVAGYVTATKPLNWGGILIEDFRLTFSEGRVVGIEATTGEANLRSILEMDEGAARLGEVALVPQSSPVAQSGRLFYNGLIDENAASHLAIGRAYADTVRNGETMSREELAARGANHSLIHIDFMIGSADMDVDGVRADGASEPVMRRGEWAFDVGDVV